MLVYNAAKISRLNVPQTAYLGFPRGFLEGIIKSGDVRLPKMLKPLLWRVFLKRYGDKGENQELEVSFFSYFWSQKNEGWNKNNSFRL